MEPFGDSSLFELKRMSIFLILLLCSCGATEENPLVIMPPTPKPVVKIEDALNLPFSVASAMPTGTATYKGTALYSRSTGNPSEIILNPDLQSDVILQANFGAMVLTGRLDGFRSISGSLISGSFTTNASVTGNRISGAIDGNLTQSGSSQTYSGQIDGSFRGQTGEFLVGEIQMTTGQSDLYGLFGSQINR